VGKILVLAEKPVLSGKKSATKRLSHDTALTFHLKTATTQIVAAAAAEIMMMTL